MARLLDSLTKEQVALLKQLRSAPGWELLQALLQEAEQNYSDRERAVPLALPDSDFKGAVAHFRGISEGVRLARTYIDALDFATGQVAPKRLY